jgi:hypothetical protein
MGLIQAFLWDSPPPPPAGAMDRPLGDTQIPFVSATPPGRDAMLRVHRIARNIRGAHGPSVTVAVAVAVTVAVAVSVTVDVDEPSLLQRVAEEATARATTTDLRDHGFHVRSATLPFIRPRLPVPIVFVKDATVIDYGLIRALTPDGKHVLLLDVDIVFDDALSSEGRRRLPIGCIDEESTQTTAPHVVLASDSCVLLNGDKSTYRNTGTIFLMVERGGLVGTRGMVRAPPTMPSPPCDPDDSHETQDDDAWAWRDPRRPVEAELL